MIDARVKETKDLIAEIDDLDRRRYQSHPHHGRSTLFFEVDCSRLGGRFLHDALVVVPTDVSLCGLEFEAPPVHLAQDLVEMARFGLRVQPGWCHGQKQG